MNERALERNLKLIPILESIGASTVFLPVFVLFTREKFGVDGALQIAALTYLFIVVLEVPSGWMSDRLGRVPTLSISAAAMMIGQLCFLFGSEFAVIALGQFFMSAGWAFISGTDVSFHFDTLEALGRGHEYAHRQARVASISYAARAVTAVIGGLLGLIHLRVPFAVALGLAAVRFTITRFFHEPGTGDVRADPFASQIAKCLAYLRNRYMGWIFFYGIALVTLEHVAFTLLQPWLTSMLDRQADDLGATPLLSGVLLAVVAFVGAGAARASAPAATRFGTVAVLIALGVLSAIIVTGMALTFSALALLLVIFRSAQGAAAPVLISAAVAPRTEQQHRATLLSINSLAGRLCYGVFLWSLALDRVDDPRPKLEIMAIVSWILVVLLVISGIWIVRNHDEVSLD